jgi:catechol 2,3-dioxygenase-like lactoylglutathione lyase family enzyme
MEAEMSSVDVSSASSAGTPPVKAGELRFEAVQLPVADVDRAKEFYEGLGWRLDIDLVAGEDYRVVQVTPPGSPCSVIFGKGVTSASPGSYQGMQLSVYDIDEARADLAAHGADVSDAFHYEGMPRERVAGPDPEGRSYFTWAAFSDPDGNGWLLQEIKTRLPGR